MRVLIASDKFKGSLTATQVCEAISQGVLAAVPHAHCELLPLADGGEGTLNVLTELLGLQVKKVTVLDPLFREITACYGTKGEDAYVEMARASGFELLDDHERSAMLTTSKGTGQLIKDAIENGAKRIFLFVGGSATNDGGIGVASALGFRFFDKDGIKLSPVGANLSSIESIETEGFPEHVKIQLITDVKNPLLGPNGAAHQYGPQKGATAEEVLHLDHGLEHLAKVIQNQFSRDISGLSGSGAAGGLALSILGLMNGTIESGIETILKLVGFDDRLKSVDLVITGEGKIDGQTLQGKVVYGVAHEARKNSVPAVAVCGDNLLTVNQISSLKLKEVLALKNEDLSVEYCLQNAADLIRLRVYDFLKGSS